MLSTLIDATDAQCHRSRMEIRRVGKSIDGNYLYFDKNLQQAIFQVSLWRNDINHDDNKHNYA